jgi:hypothetical protein
MAKDDYDTLYHPVRLWRSEGYADLFIERGVMKGGIGFDEFCVLSVVPRGDVPRVDVKMDVDQLERIAAWLTEYARRMRASACNSTD